MADFDSDKRRRRFARTAERKRRRVERRFWVYKAERQQRRLEQRAMGVSG